MAHVIFHLVHGTQFYLLEKPEIRWLRCGKPRVPWVEKDSTLAKALRAELEGHRVEIKSVPWSGRNRHGARLDAAQRICRSVLEAPRGAYNFLIAHSHGGNACLLALKKAEEQLQRSEERGTKAETRPEEGEECRADLVERVAGIGFLSVPFLVVQKAEWAMQALLAWAGITCLSIPLIVRNVTCLRGFQEIAVDGILLGLVFFPLMWALKHYGSSKDWMQAPASFTHGATDAPTEREQPSEPKDPPRATRIPMLTVRCPGDEIFGAFGLAMTVARAIHLLENKAAWPFRLMKRNFLTYLAVGTPILIAVIAVSLIPSPLQTWLSDHWVSLLLVIAALLPIRLFLYGIAYGFDLIGLPLSYSISAEASPLGRSKTELVAPSTSEERQFAHSEIYKLKRVHKLLAGWSRELLPDAEDA